MDLSCNRFYNCTNCAVGSGYVKFGGQCLRCQELPNCIQCSEINFRLCTQCKKGFYLHNNTKVCMHCPTSCSECSGPRSCISCAEGFFHSENTSLSTISSNRCNRCAFPCATCKSYPNYCITCANGYTKMNWKCQKDLRIKITIIVSDDILIVIAKYDDIIKSLLRLLRKS